MNLEHFLRFANPVVLFAIAAVLLAAAHVFIVLPGRRPTLRVSFVSDLVALPRSTVGRLHRLPAMLRLLACTLLVVAAARPQAGRTVSTVLTEGIDIVMAVDVSRSMLAEDFKPRNRLSVAKATIADFIRGRHSDRIGLVVFAGRAYTQCPLTIDYGVLTGLLDQIEVGMLEDPTAIGTALATATARLRDSDAKSRIIILVTDGRSNAGTIDPLTAADIAATMDVKVYAIGVGREGDVDYPDPRTLFGYTKIRSDIDEGTLRQISERTGGEFFRARDPSTLAQIFSRIDQMERTKQEVRDYTRYRELFWIPAGLALLLLAIEAILSGGRFRGVPA